MKVFAALCALVNLLVHAQEGRLGLGDHCIPGSVNCTVENSDCLGEPGSETCQCLEGYVEDADTCSIISERQGELGEECDPSLEELACLDPNAECPVNGPFPFCQCKEGFVEDAGICRLPNLGDECNPIEGCADENTECIEIGENWICDCIWGFLEEEGECKKATGVHCMDTTECVSNAECTGTSGAETCECVEGFLDDSGYCTQTGQCLAVIKKERSGLLTDGGHLLYDVSVSKALCIQALRAMDNAVHIWLRGAGTSTIYPRFIDLRFQDLRSTETGTERHAFPLERRRKQSGTFGSGCLSRSMTITTARDRMGQVPQRRWGGFPHWVRNAYLRLDVIPSIQSVQFLIPITSAAVKMDSWKTQATAVSFFVVVVEAGGSCTDTSDCVSYADCDDGTCTCRPGYIEELGQCKVPAGWSCSESHDCVSNAECTEDICTCLPGHEEVLGDCTKIPRGLGDDCEMDEDCNADLALECDDELKRCY
ncbi:unnamed protein product [Darwinula stevensoni]|uniref:EGF-like domain-containing protein n=1 Tax=Darwinula stevensoni TaxID=69355 RepID=A0A7R8XEG7_9CRUS|nr:unnamed protein product [Darwinula stevensoni]CAG0895793.1 unnamed protein product [Darwinula stevensoni]